MSWSSAAESQRGSSAYGGAGEADLHVVRDADGVALVVVGLPAEQERTRRA